MDVKQTLVSSFMCLQGCSTGAVTGGNEAGSATSFAIIVKVAGGCRDQQGWCSSCMPAYTDAVTRPLGLPAVISFGANQALLRRGRAQYPPVLRAGAIQSHA